MSEALSNGTGVELPNTIHQNLLAMFVGGQQVAMRDQDLAFGRQRDAATHALQTLQAVAAVELLVSNDPSEVARLNTAVRTPTTISHPSMIGDGTK